MEKIIYCATVFVRKICSFVQYVHHLYLAYKYSYYHRDNGPYYQHVDYLRRRQRRKEKQKAQKAQKAQNEQNEDLMFFFHPIDDDKYNDNETTDQDDDDQLSLSSSLSSSSSSSFSGNIDTRQETRQDTQNDIDSSSYSCYTTLTTNNNNNEDNDNEDNDNASTLSSFSSKSKSKSNSKSKSESSSLPEDRDPKYMDLQVIKRSYYDYTSVPANRIQQCVDLQLFNLCCKFIKFETIRRINELMKQKCIISDMRSNDVCLLDLSSGQCRHSNYFQKLHCKTYCVTKFEYTENNLRETEERQFEKVYNGYYDKSVHIGQKETEYKIYASNYLLSSYSSFPGLNSMDNEKVNNKVYDIIFCYNTLRYFCKFDKVKGEYVQLHLLFEYISNHLKSGGCFVGSTLQGNRLSRYFNYFNIDHDDEYESENHNPIETNRTNRTNRTKSLFQAECKSMFIFNTFHSLGEYVFRYEEHLPGYCPGYRTYLPKNKVIRKIADDHNLILLNWTTFYNYELPLSDFLAETYSREKNQIIDLFLCKMFASFIFVKK